MKEWLLDYLRCNDLKIFISGVDKDTGEPFSGMILCDSIKFYIRRGIAIFLKKEIAQNAYKLRGLYEALPPAPWKAYRNDWIRHMRMVHLKMLVETITKYVKTIGKRRQVNILSIGCGWGWEIWAITKILDNLGVKKFRLIGVDIARKPLKLAKKILKKRQDSRIEFAVAPAEKLPFKNNIFDIVTAIFGALDHSEKYVGGFKEIARVIKPGGKIVFTVLNRFAIDWFAKILGNPRLFIKTIKKAKELFTRVTIPLPQGGAVRIPTHYYIPNEVSKLLKMFCFKRIKTYGIFVILPMNFKKENFSSIDKFLSKIECRIDSIFPFYHLGRYIGVIAEKALE